MAGKVEHTINEKNILFCIDCKFIVRMYDYFLDTRCLYFVLEFVNGGEMFTIIQKQKRRRFTEEQTKFFAGPFSFALFVTLRALDWYAECLSSLCTRTGPHMQARAHALAHAYMRVSLSLSSSTFVAAV
jgi:hypothetical protein